MTTTTPAAAPAGIAPAGADTGRAARRVRDVVLWVLVFVVGGVLVALAAGSPSPEEYLHPDGTGQSGTRALVEVLTDQGVDVRVVGTAGDAVAATGTGAGATVVVGNSDLLTSTAARRLLQDTRGADRVVFLDGAPRVLADLGLGVEVTYPPVDPGAADCGVPWVRPDDELARISWSILATADDLPAGAQACYPIVPPEDRGSSAEPPPTGWASVDLPATDRHAPVTVLGFPDAATNRFVTEADHAGLVVRLLGASPTLVWYHPAAEDLTQNPAPADEQSVWPAWVEPGLLVAALAFLVLALARGRRLGRLVPEPLPVVVRATETTESRAELYRAAGDRGRAAGVLRRASAGRLAARLGLAPGTPHPALVSAVADATGTPAAEVDALLRDVPPSDEAALVMLAQQLAHLEEKVRTS